MRLYIANIDVTSVLYLDAGFSTCTDNSKGKEDSNFVEKTLEEFKKKMFRFNAHVFHF